MAAGSNPAPATKPGIWYVYVLASLKNGRHYTGFTNNVGRRLAEHNRGKNAYARRAGPFTLVYWEAHPSAEQARQRERFLKTGYGRAFLEDELSG